MMWGWYDGMGWWMLFGSVFMILFWGGVIFLIVWGIRRLSRRDRGSFNESKSPLDIAKERYARGEITKEQFEQIKKDIM